MEKTITTALEARTTATLMKTGVNNLFFVLLRYLYLHLLLFDLFVFNGCH